MFRRPKKNLAIPGVCEEGGAETELAADARASGDTQRELLGWMGFPMWVGIGKIMVKITEKREGLNMFEPPEYGENWIDLWRHQLNVSSTPTGDR